jgi:hypothetical protein
MTAAPKTAARAAKALPPAAAAAAAVAESAAGAASAAGLVRARALVDLPRWSVLAGHCVQGPAPLVQALHEANQVDPVPAAVEYALANGGTLTDIA